jgi:AcrR family transcriptional regulator
MSGFLHDERHVSQSRGLPGPRIVKGRGQIVGFILLKITMKSGSSPAKRPSGTMPRAEAADARRKILDAAVELFAQKALDEITVEDVTAKAGVTEQVVTKLFGSRDGLVSEAAKDLLARAPLARLGSTGGDVSSAVSALVQDYEAWGDITLRALAQEDRVPSLHRYLELGRVVQHDWVGKAFAPILSRTPGNARDRRHAQLVAVCDVPVWKSLRRDSKLTPEQTIVALVELIEGLAKLDG